MTHSNRRGGGRRGGGGSDPLAAAEASINSIANLVINLDDRDLATGALTHWIDRKNAYDFAGTATKGASGVTGNGTSNVLTSTAAISQINGASAVTIIAAMSDTWSGAGTKIPYELSAGGATTDAFAAYVDTSGGRLHSYLAGDIGISDYYIAETLATPCVITQQMDKALATAEAALFRKNGSVVASTLATNTNNTNTFGSYTLNLLSRAGGVGSTWWSGSFRKFLLFSRALTAGEMLQAERAVGIITGITVA